MVENKNSILYVGTHGIDSNNRERALVASGFGVASVDSPEAAVTHVKNSGVLVVLLEDSGWLDIPLLASCLKTANPFVRIVALTSHDVASAYIDTLLPKPVSVESLLQAIHNNLAISRAAAESA